ncbi:pentatricopeptide repeat-containing protein At5g16860-like [Selaginella moellendorffii]|uniref:pentatricopeptide repeat-containing protein At5g16860-like n=1 Tax=Selaginella moellendorffii TaxID=88036 RepID=UPI000D1C9EB6|nr:pentatricopeptide repeat-containing protein At5g16860-like [Selaginella moellendorffii]|eukprot:XP_024532786.1 pentatricopeptide repeat-containing protein At5g16860-like [Selaginella moellendorffii]
MDLAAAPSTNSKPSELPQSREKKTTVAGKSISSFLVALRECSNARDLRSGKNLHAEAINKGWSSTTYVSNSLVNMYAKCGSLADAREVFDKMQTRSVVSWNSLVLGYVDNGEPRVALELFEKMLAGRRCEPSALTFMAALKACAAMAASEHSHRVEGKSLKLRCLEIGMAVYSRAAMAGFDTDILVATTLVNMFAKCGSLDDARRIFDAMPNHSVVSWNAMLLGCVENGRAKLALDLFSRMLQTKTLANSRTFVAAFKACAALADEEQGRELDDHSGKILKLKSLETAMALHLLAASSRACDLSANLFVVSGLIDMYAKSGCMDLARRQFDAFQARHDVVSTTALLLGYAENGEEERALDLFSKLPGDVEPGTPTFVAAIKACTGMAAREEPRQLGKLAIKARSLETGMAIHARLIASRLLDLDKFAASSLVDMYAKCGSALDSGHAFAAIERPDTVAWNALILSYADTGEESLALESLARMELAAADRCSCRPDSRTYAAALKACGNLASLAQCRRIHSALLRRGFREEHDEVLANCLVDVYGRCGGMGDARRVFDSMPAAGLVTWNTLLAGYGRQGDTDMVFRSLGSMSREGGHADTVTLTSLLAACSHAGLVGKARQIFGAIAIGGGNHDGVFSRISPEIGHYHAMIDMLGRANELEEAAAMVAAMPFQPSAVTWMILLNACAKWRNVAVGRRAFESLVPLGGTAAAAAHVLMSNIYESEPPLDTWQPQQLPSVLGPPMSH